MTTAPDPRKVPANEVQLRAALRAVLGWLASKAISDWEAGARQSIETLLAQVPAGPRRSLWAAQMNLLAAHLRQQLAPRDAQLFAGSTDEAIADLADIHHGLLVEEVDPVPAKVSMTMLNRLGPFVSATAAMKHLEDVVLPAATVEFEEFAGRPTRLEPFLAHSMLSWTNTFQECSLYVQAANEIELSVQRMGLTALLDLLVGPLLVQRDKASAAIQVTPLQIADLVDRQLTTNFTAPEAQQRQLIVDLCATPAADAQGCLLNLQGGLVRVSPELIAGFEPLVTMGPAAIKKCTELKVLYKRPWLLCLGSLDPAEQQRLVTHCTNQEIDKAVRKRLAQAPSLELLSKVVGILTWQNRPWDVVCSAINTFGYTQITLPQPFQAIAWQPLHDLWVPVALQSAGMETDQKCLKHICEELGAAPSKAKAEAYFTELATACADACQAWRSQGKPPQLDLPQLVPSVAHPVGTWRIIVRNLFNSPQVFHVDSGYKKSPWVARPN